MMDNQHIQIKGYRDLSADEIELMNAVKTAASALAEPIAMLEQMPEIDKRWLAIGKTDLQKGFMSVIRAIARPESF